MPGFYRPMKHFDADTATRMFSLWFELKNEHGLWAHRHVAHAPEYEALADHVHHYAWPLVRMVEHARRWASGDRYDASPRLVIAFRYDRDRWGYTAEQVDTDDERPYRELMYAVWTFTLKHTQLMMPVLKKPA